MVYEKLMTILARVKPNVDITGITMESRLVADLGIDSLSMMLLAISVEDEFGIEFAEETNFTTVKEICDFVAQKSGLEV